MDIVNFSKQIITNKEKLQSIFTNYFDQHVAMYYLASKIPVQISTEVDSAEIKYMVKPERIDELQSIIDCLSRPVSIYDKTFIPDITILDEYLVLILKDK